MLSGSYNAYVRFMNLWKLNPVCNCRSLLLAASAPHFDNHSAWSLEAWKPPIWTRDNVGLYPAISNQHQTKSIKVFIFRSGRDTLSIFSPKISQKIGNVWCRFRCAGLMYQNEHCSYSANLHRLRMRETDRRVHVMCSSTVIWSTF